MTSQSCVDNLRGCWRDAQGSAVETIDVCVGAQLSAGGMKLIHQCRVTLLGKAGKLCDCVLAVARGKADNKMQEALEREISIMRHLQTNGSHPKIVQLLYYAQRASDCCDDYIDHLAIIEKVHPIGYDLDCVINKYAWMQVQVPVPFTKYIIGQLVDALSHIHKCGVVHRDLKASNVLVGPKSTCKLIDFGLAARIPAKDKFARMQLSWEERYFAPEMMIGNDQNGAVDCWGIGIIMHQIYQRRASIVQMNDGELTVELGDKRHRFRDMDSSTETAMRSLLQADIKSRWDLTQLNEAWIKLGDARADELDIPDGNERSKGLQEHVQYFSQSDPRLAVYCTTIGWRQVDSAQRGQIDATCAHPSSVIPTLSWQEPVASDASSGDDSPVCSFRRKVNLEKGMIVWHAHHSGDEVLARVLNWDSSLGQTQLEMSDCTQWVHAISFRLCGFQEGEVYEVSDDGLPFHEVDDNVHSSSDGEFDVDGLPLQEDHGRTRILRRGTQVELMHVPLVGLPQPCDSPTTWARARVGEELHGRVPLERYGRAALSRGGVEGCTLGELGIGPKSVLTVLLVRREQELVLDSPSEQLAASDKDNFGARPDEQNVVYNACPDTSTLLQFGDRVLFAERSRGVEVNHDLFCRLGFNLQNAREVGGGPMMEVALDFDCFTFPRHIEIFGTTVSIGPRGSSTNPPDLCLDLEQNFHVKLAGVVYDRTGAIEWFPGPKTLVRPGDKGLVIRIPQLDGTSRSCLKTSRHLEAFMDEVQFRQKVRRRQRANRKNPGSGYSTERRPSQGLGRHREVALASELGEDEEKTDYRRDTEWPK